MTETTIQAELANLTMARENLTILYSTTLRKVMDLKRDCKPFGQWPTETIEQLLWAIKYVCEQHDDAMKILGNIRGIAERNGCPSRESLTEWVESLATPVKKGEIQP